MPTRACAPDSGSIRRFLRQCRARQNCLIWTSPCRSAGARDQLPVDGVIGVAGPAGAGARTVGAECRDIGLAQYNGTGRLQAGNDGGVLLRDQLDSAELFAERGPAEGGREAGDVDGFLDDNRHTCKGPSFSPAARRRSTSVAS